MYWMPMFWCIDLLIHACTQYRFQVVIRHQWTGTSQCSRKHPAAYCPIEMSAILEAKCGPPIGTVAETRIVTRSLSSVIVVGKVSWMAMRMVSRQLLPLGGGCDLSSNYKFLIRFRLGSNYKYQSITHYLLHSMQPQKYNWLLSSCLIFQISFWFPLLCKWNYCWWRWRWSRRYNGRLECSLYQLILEARFY